MNHLAAERHLTQREFLPYVGSIMEKSRYSALIFAAIFTAAIVLLLR